MKRQELPRWLFLTLHGLSQLALVGVAMSHALHPSSAALVAGCREHRCPGQVSYGSRRRKASVRSRSTGCGTLLLLAMMLASTAGASPFKSPFKRWGNRKGGKGGQQQSVSSKRSGAGKRDKVRSQRRDASRPRARLVVGWAPGRMSCLFVLVWYFSCRSIFIRN